MKRKFKIIISLGLCFVFLFTSGITVFANTTNGELTINKDHIAANNKLVVNLSFDDSKETLVNIADLKGTVNYDENVFETIDKGNFSLSENFSNLIFDKDTNTFSVTKHNENTENLNIFSVNLTMKNDMSTAESSISIDNFSGSTSKGAITSDDVKSVLTISDTETESAKQENASNSKILWIILAVLVFVLGSAITLYLRRNKEDTNLNKALFILLFFVVAIIILFASGVFSKSKTDDLEPVQDQLTIDFKISPSIIDDDKSDSTDTLLGSTIAGVNQPNTNGSSSNGNYNGGFNDLNILPPTTEVPVPPTPGKPVPPTPGKPVPPTPEVPEPPTPEVPEPPTPEIPEPPTPEPDDNITDDELFLNSVDSVTDEGITKIDFNKNEKIKLHIRITNTSGYIPESVVIDGKTYTLTSLGGDLYEVVLDGYKNYGVEKIKIEKININNQTIKIKKNNVVTVNILKDAPKVTDFKYEVLDMEHIRVFFKITDKDKALDEGKTIINDSVTDIDLQNNLNSKTTFIDFKPNTNELYNFKLNLDYNLNPEKSTSTGNVYTDSNFLDEPITHIQELLELKDITYTNLIAKTGETASYVYDINIPTFDPSAYVAEVHMKNMPTFYAEIESGAVKDGKFMLNLVYDNAVSYDGVKKISKMQAPFGSVTGDQVSSLTFEKIISIVTADPTADITLTRDLSAFELHLLTNAVMDVDYQGVFDGNGYSIEGLTKPLFKSINGGTVKNLVIESPTTAGSGIFGSMNTNTTITNVHVKNLTVTGTATGGFASTTSGDTVIESSSLSNLNLIGGKRSGGFYGIAQGSVTIKNSYVTGNIKTDSDAVGGMLGQTGSPVTIENSYVDLTLNVPGSHAHAGMLGYASGARKIITNSISLATGPKGKTVIGSGGLTSTNSYEITESTLISNATSGIIPISKNNINKDFISNTLKFDEKIWNIPNDISGAMPTLIGETPQLAYSLKSDTYIPQIDRLKSLSTYDDSREIAYHNMNMLMPFYDAKLYVDNGNLIPDGDILNTQKIKTIYAFDSNDKLVSGLNTSSFDSISKIKVVFEDEQVKDYALTFKKMVSDVATYKFNDLGIGYNYHKFVLNTNISLVDELITTANAMDYATTISAVTPETEDRLYVDYFNESVKPDLANVVTDILQNENLYNLYLDNDILKTKIKQDITGNQQLEKLLFTYNYYAKWYHFEIGGAKMSDVLLLNSPKMINSDSNIRTLTFDTIQTNSTQRDINKSVTFFDGQIKPKTGKDLKTFLAYYMKVLAGYESGNDWFTDNFKGVMGEKGVEGKEDEIRYRAWDLMNVRSHLVLPILSAPQEDMYIISVPTQFALGSLNRYAYHVNGDTATTKAKVALATELMGNFYSTSSTFVANSTDILNSRVHINYDTRLGFPGIGDQHQGTTQDPVLKWVYEPSRSFAPNNGSGAYANGTDIYWVVYRALDAHFEIFTHETAHNQDGYYFYGRGRRNPSGPEDHADANIAQGLRDGTSVFNLTQDYSLDSTHTTNRTLDRISSPEKIESFYREMYETFYVLDYLTAQAFLKLTPDEQAAVAVQTDDSTPGTSIYSKLTGDQFAAMDLKTMEDLWDNKIAFKNAGSKGMGSYGEETHYNINWYLAHNDTGRADANSFKRFGFEMLGVGGYQDGYVAARSSASANDLEALRTATGDPTITFKEYKMDRYNTVEENLANIPYFDADKVIDAYSKALEKDALVTNSRSNTDAVRRALYGMVQRGTNDFEKNTVYSFAPTDVQEISTAQSLIDSVSKDPIGTYKLTADLDFSAINITGQNAYMLDTFYGTLDGNGFVLKGINKPLFAKASFASIKNLTIDTPNYLATSNASIAIEGNSLLFDTIKVLNTNVLIKLVEKNAQTCIELNPTEITQSEYIIDSAEDINEINADTTTLSRKSNYKLANDIDVSSITGRPALISGDFIGKINGDGYTISNASSTVLSSISGGTVENLKLKDFTINNRGGTSGGLVTSANNAVIKNIELDNITVYGTNTIGSLIATSNNSNISNITATNVHILGSSGVYHGGLIGRSNFSNVSNVVVQGNMTVGSTHNGGVLGSMNTGSLTNAYSNVSMVRNNTSPAKSNTAGLVGVFENAPGPISNSIAVGDVSENMYKIISAVAEQNITEIDNNVKNVYEITEATGTTSVTPSGVIKSIPRADLLNTSFYTDSLKWTTDIWDFSQVATGGMPILK